MKGKHRELLLVALGAAVFAGLRVFSNFGTLACAGFTLAGYLGFRLILPRRREDDLEVAPGITRRHLDETIAKGMAATRRFEQLAARIRKREVSKQVRQIAQIVRDIFRNLKEDPGDIHVCRAFIDRRLDETIGMIEDYVRLSGRALDEKGNARLAEAEKSLGRICRGFDGQLQKCLADDFRRLETDSKMTEYLFPTEGQMVPPKHESLE